MNIRKKVVSILLIVALIMTTLPVQLFATEKAQNETPIGKEDMLKTKTTTSAGIEVNQEVVFIGEGFEAEFKVVSKWQGAFNGEIKLTNTGSKPIENWLLHLTFPHKITNIWNADVIEHQKDIYFIKNKGWNANILPGQSINIGFGANYSEYISAPTFYSLPLAIADAKEEDYTINFEVISDWGQAFNATISIENNTDKTIEAWTLEFDFDRNIQQFWTAKIENHEGNHYVIKNAGWNANIEPGQTLELGFSGNSGNVNSRPTGYKLSYIGENDEMQDESMDTDEDGLPDYLEKQIGSDPNSKDTDQDGIEDGYEYCILDTDTTKEDSDGNGIPDGKEDFDKDELNNLEEYLLGTNPYSEDTDCDGLKDGEEAHNYETDPLLYDTDEDGICDGDEIKLGLDPLSKYTHGNTLDNEYMINHTVSNTILDSINKETNPYFLSIDVLASGNAADNIIVKPSDYGVFLHKNDAIVGEIVQIEYFDGILQEGRLSFKLDERLIEEAKHELLEGLKRYYVFAYDEELNIPVPVPTVYDENNNALYADITGVGSYFIMDLEKLYTDLNISQSASRQVASDTLQTYSDSTLSSNPLNKQELRNSMNTLNTNQNLNKKLDLILVIDTGSTIESYLDIIKVSLQELLDSLVNDEKLDLNVSIIEYKDIARGGFVKINETLATKAEGNFEVSFTNNIHTAYKIINNLNASGGWDLNSTPLAALGYVESLPYRKDAQRFSLLITDKLYRVDNEHGYPHVYSLLDKLNEKNVSVSVVTLHTSEFSAYERWTNYSNGIKISMFKLVRFDEAYTDFIINNLFENQDFQILLANSLKKVRLEAPLERNGLTDTDRDTQTDSEEVNWQFINQNDDGSYELPTLEDLWELSEGGNIFDRISNLPLYTQLKSTVVLPIVSDPTEKDSDGDTYEDSIDARPLAYITKKNYIFRSTTLESTFDAYVNALEMKVKIENRNSELIPVTYRAHFAQEWNKMGIDNNKKVEFEIDKVFILAHGSATRVHLGVDRLFTNNDLYLLEDKKINLLRFNSCNVGNLDWLNADVIGGTQFTQNLAIDFLKAFPGINKIEASDGYYWLGSLLLIIPTEQAQRYSNIQDKNTVGNSGFDIDSLTKNGRYREATGIVTYWRENGNITFSPKHKIFIEPNGKLVYEEITEVIK